MLLKIKWKQPYLEVDTNLNPRFHRSCALCTCDILFVSLGSNFGIELELLGYLHHSV